MKRNFAFFLLISVSALITACGGGGGSSGNSSSASAAVQPDNAVEKGSVQVQFKRKVATRTAEVYTQPLDEPSIVRVVVRDEETGFKIIEDFPVPETVEGTLRVPVGEGYSVAAISYLEGAARSNRNLILKTEEISGVDVVKDSVTNISLVLEPPRVNIDIPETGKEGSEVDFSSSNEEFFGRGFRLFYNFETMDYESVSAFPDNEIVATDSGRFNLPQVQEEKPLYLLFEHYLSENFLNDGENFVIFAWYSPINEDYLQILVQPEEGQIGVDIEY